MNLNSYLETARRCVCLSVAPASLPGVINLFNEASASLERAYYWRKGTGLLLLQSSSQNHLHEVLKRLRMFPRKSLPLLNQRSRLEHFPLPPFRFCSDPSIWPVSTAMECLPEDLVEIQPDPLTTGALEKCLLRCDSVRGQMQTLVDRTALSHPFRLALFTFSDALAEILDSIRPGSVVYPFGSAINGLGSMTSDLDAVVQLGVEIPPRLRTFAESFPKSNVNFHRHSTSHSLSILQDLLGYLGQPNYHILTPIRLLLNRIDPLSASASRVFPGRNPIINYSRHRCLGVGVDISTCPKDGDSAQLVLRAAYWMRALVTQVPVFLYLASALKYLMRGVHITHHGPSQGFTNYKLVALLVSFLQSAVGQAPALEYLILPRDDSVTQKLVIPLEKHPECPAEGPELLREFFCFLRALKPENTALCLRSGRLVSRGENPGDDASRHFLYCPNPLNPEFNITHGITPGIWKEFVATLGHMETAMDKAVASSEFWGLPAMTRSQAAAAAAAASVETLSQSN